MTTLLLIIIYIAFISLGLPDSMIGAAWPTIRTDLSLPMAGAGLISMIIYGGTIISSIMSGKLIQKFGTGKLTLISVFMTAMALLGFSFSQNYVWLCLVAIPLGLGAGAVDAALNNFVALHFSARHMSWLHCFWGIGATAGPLIMSVAISQNGLWQKGYLTVAIVQICLVVILLVSLPLWRLFHVNVQEDTIIENENQHVFRLPGIRPALLSFFCYCALEITAGLWGASYLVQSKGVSADVAAGWIAIYYLGITIGRFINGFITAKWSNPALIRGGQFIIGIGAVLLLISNYTYINLIGLTLIGMGCAPIYPSMLHETPIRFGKNNSSKLMGVQMAFAYIGSTTVPPAIGILLGVIGIQYYPVFILVLLIVMIVSSEKINKIVARRLKMVNQLDLHMHSNISNDGQYTPSQLLQMCKQQGLKTVALADHNSVRGIAEALESASRLGIEFISAIELDCQFEGVNLHLLGYGIDPTFAEFERNEKDILKKEQEASSKRMQLVQDLGFKFETEKVLALAIEGVVTGEMIAEVALNDKRNRNNHLLEPYRKHGKRSDNPYVNFYWDYCSQGKSAYVPVQFIGLNEAGQLIKKAGGIAVLAHPGINIGQDQKLLEGIVACGIDGIEVYSSYHDENTAIFYKEQAEKFHLLKTLGSDFHGKTKPSIKLGSMHCQEETDIYHQFKKKLCEASIVKNDRGNYSINSP